MKKDSSPQPRLLPTAALVAVAVLALRTPHAQAGEACAARYTVAAGAVTDNDTHLVWQQAPEPSDAGTRTWPDAEAYCASLPLSGGGWRLPTVFELLTLVDDSTSLPAIEATVFLNTGANLPGDTIFWTSTPNALDPATPARWYVNFGLGNTQTDPLSKLHHVRCVRPDP